MKKFMVWDKKNKYFISDDDDNIADIAITLGGKVFSPDSYYKIRDEDFELLQHIGQEDIEGTEIYEGMIVEFLGGWVGEVVFQNAGYWADLRRGRAKSGTWLTKENIQLNKVKVVGWKFTGKLPDFKEDPK